MGLRNCKYWIIIACLVSLGILVVGMSWSQMYGYKKGFHDGKIFGIAEKQNTKEKLLN